MQNRVAPWSCARRAAANKDRVIVLGEQRFETIDALAAGKFNAEVEDVLAFLVEHCFGEAEFGNLCAHHPAGLRILVENDALVAHGREITRHSQ